MANDKAAAHSSLSGLGKFVLSQVQSLAGTGATVADLGTGTGRLAGWLAQAGFRVTAADLSAAYFEPTGIPIVTCDLNADFAAVLGGPFDGIVATELMEHLENPRGFLRQCHRLLKDSGWLVLTTPNLENPVSKALFVRHDHFLWFSDKEHKATGHITPIGRWYLEKAAQDTGFAIQCLRSYGCPYSEIASWPRMKALARVLAWVAGTPEELRGEILFVLMRKLTSRASRPPSLSTPA